MKTTALYPRHLELNAQMTEFAGYQMPVRYVSDKQEHLAVRENAGLFDVSHMGEVWITGPKAQQAVARLFTQDPSRYQPGQAYYCTMLNPQAGIVDDVIVYMFSPERYWVCVNAGNRDKDYRWIQDNCDAQVEDVSDAWSQVAIQGPQAVAITAQHLGDFVREIKRFRFVQHQDLIIARTGYTGEDGFEIFIPNDQVVNLWEALSQKAAPCGLAARDTLRLEAGMCLYGQDIHDNITPQEAGLDWTIRFERDTPFIGQAALQQAKIGKRLVGLNMQGTGIARPHYQVCLQTGESIGEVTSGTKTPYLNRAIAMAHIRAPYCDELEQVYVRIRDRLEPAQITKLPFYRRAS